MNSQVLSTITINSNTIIKGVNKRFLVILLTVLFILIIPISTNYTPKIIRAHDIIEQSWLTVNGEDLLEYRPGLTKTNLPNAERQLTNNLDVGKSYKFAINTQAFSNKLNIPIKNISATWIVNGQEVSTSDTYNFTVSDPGIYILKVPIYNINTGKEIFSDTLAVQVGEFTASLPVVKINGEKYDFVIDSGSRFTLSQDTKFNFEAVEVADATSTVWEIAGHLYNKSKVQHKYDISDLPSYAVLRVTDTKTNVFYDFYVTLRAAPQVQSSTVPRPSVPLQHDKSINNSKNTQMLQVLTIIGVTLITFILFYRGIKFKKKRGK